MLRSDILESGKQSVFMERLVNRIEFLVEDIRDDPSMTGWRQMSGDNISSLDPTLVPEDILRRRARAAYLKDPYGRGIIRTLVKFIIGSGFLIDFTEEDKKKKKLILKWWRAVKKKVKWTRFIRELVTRAFRDGEVFVWRFTPSSDGDIISQIRFIDPDDVKDINTANTDVETVESYTLKINNKETTVAANEIAHLKINVDSNVKRGRSVLESMLPLFTKHGKWLEARMLLNIVRTSIALVQQVDGPSTDLFRLRGAQASHRSGQQDQAKMVRPGTILRGTPGVKYQMLSPNLDAKDAAEDGKHILLAVASAAGLPDVMVTCDYEGSNFASTVVAQNPAIREFEDWQSFFAEFFSEIIAWFMEDGVQANWTVEEDNIDFDIAFPPILSRDIGQETSAYHLMYTDGAISLRTYRLSSGFNPDTEEEQVDIEGGPPIQKQPQAGASQQKLVPKGVEDRNPRQNVKAGTESSVQEERIPIKKKKEPKVVVVNVKGEGKMIRPITLEYLTKDDQNEPSDLNGAGGEKQEDSLGREELTQ